LAIRSARSRGETPDAGCEQKPDHFSLLRLGREVQWGPADPVWERDRVASLEPPAHTLKVTL